MLFYNLNNFIGKQIARCCSIIVPYYPNKFFVQEQMEKCFSDSSRLGLGQQKPTMIKSKSVSFDLDNRSLPPNKDKPTPNYHIKSLDNQY